MIGRHRGLRGRRLPWVAAWLAAPVLALAAVGVPAAVAWVSAGAGSATGTLRAGTDPVPAVGFPRASVTGTSITVSWPVSRFSDGSPVAGYLLRRYVTGSTTPAATRSCPPGSGTLVQCAMSGVGAGKWQLTVATSDHGWIGPESARVTAVVRGTAPRTLTMPTTIDAWRSDQSATVAGFPLGDKVSLRVGSPYGAVLLAPHTVTSDPQKLPTYFSGGSLPSGPTTVYAVDTAGGAVASAPTVVNDGPFLAHLRMYDRDGDGKVDTVKAAFNGTLATSYSAGTKPWLLNDVPSCGSLQRVTADGNNTFTLHLAEGSCGADTSVGGFTVAMNPAANGVRDSRGNQAAFGPTAPEDDAAPVALSAQMQDDDHDGRVDFVVVHFSEPLVGTTAPASQWSLAHVPSGGTLRQVNPSGRDVVVQLNEGTGTPDTSVGSFALSMRSNSAGLRDAANNPAAGFAGLTPADAAAPVPVGFLFGGGGVTGKAETGNWMRVEFSEPLAALRRSTGQATFIDGGSGTDRLTIDGLTWNSLDTGSTAYLVPTRRSGTVAAFQATLRQSGRYVTVGLGSCAGACRELRASSGVFTFIPSDNITDGHNAAAGQLKKWVQLF